LESFSLVCPKVTKTILFSLFPVDTKKNAGISPSNLPVFYNWQVIITQTLKIFPTLVSQQESWKEGVKEGKKENDEINKKREEKKRY
jgi:hypothetical protein